VDCVLTKELWDFVVEWKLAEFDRKQALQRQGSHSAMRSPVAPGARASPTTPPVTPEVSPAPVMQAPPFMGTQGTQAKKGTQGQRGAQDPPAKASALGKAGAQALKQAGASKGGGKGSGPRVAVPTNAESPEARAAGLELAAALERRRAINGEDAARAGGCDAELEEFD